MPGDHIDAVTVPTNLLGNVSNVEVGSSDDWVATRLSDHVPITIDLGISSCGLGARPQPLPGRRC